jgi:hypothetical protein
VYFYKGLIQKRKFKNLREALDINIFNMKNKLQRKENLV